MYHLLIDTSVWIDLAKDPKHRPLFEVLEDLVFKNYVRLIVPRTIIDEFQRSKTRIIQENKRSLTSHFKQVREAVKMISDSQEEHSFLEKLNDVDHKVTVLGDLVFAGSFSKIEELLRNFPVIEITDSVKIRIAQRMIDGKAPFHKNKDSAGDAIIIETYADYLKANDSAQSRFVFITHNFHDFSATDGNRMLPHPDLADMFIKRKSLYFISLAEALKKVFPVAVSETMLEHEQSQPPRTISEILKAEHEIEDKIWYNRHQISVQNLSPENTPANILQNAKKASESIESLYGIDQLGPWSDFEWGMLNGKLSALRWVIGEDWDMLDT